MLFFPWMLMLFRISFFFESGDSLGYTPRLSHRTRSAGVAGWNGAAISEAKVPFRDQTNPRLMRMMVGGVTINKPPSKQLAPPKGDTKARAGGGAKFRVLLFNDPVNTKEYVARMLMTKSGLTEDSAFQCMMQAHKIGMGLVGIWLRERAEAITKELQEAGLTVTMIPDE